MCVDHIYGLRVTVGIYFSLTLAICLEIRESSIASQALSFSQLRFRLSLPQFQREVNTSITSLAWDGPFFYAAHNNYLYT